MDGKLSPPSMLSKSTISTSNPSGTVSSITHAHPPETVTNIFRSAITQSLNGWETVAPFDVIEVDDLYFESFGDRVVHHTCTSARNCHKYLQICNNSEPEWMGNCRPLRCYRSRRSLLRILRGPCRPSHMHIRQKLSQISSDLQ